MAWLLNLTWPKLHTPVMLFPIASKISEDTVSLLRSEGQMGISSWLGHRVRDEDFQIPLILFATQGSNCTHHQSHLPWQYLFSVSLKQRCKDHANLSKVYQSIRTETPLTDSTHFRLSSSIIKVWRTFLVGWDVLVSILWNDFLKSLKPTASVSNSSWSLRVHQD